MGYPSDMELSVARDERAPWLMDSCQTMVLSLTGASDGVQLYAPHARRTMIAKVVGPLLDTRCSRDRRAEHRKAPAASGVAMIQAVFLHGFDSKGLRMYGRMVETG